MNNDFFYSLERPHQNLLKYYFAKAAVSGPFFVVIFPLLLCRYLTLRYHVDDEGLSMRWGLVFRKEINLTYAKIQDIHLVSNVIQRWLGLADIYIQTASGSADAEMIIEGIKDFSALRNFIYSKMRGYKDAGKAPSPGQPAQSEAALLSEILEELRGARAAVDTLVRVKGEKQSGGGGA